MPKIEGEEEDKKFGVTVNLNKADAFLGYNPVKREFSILSDLSSIQTSNEFLAVTISI